MTGQRPEQLLVRAIDLFGAAVDAVPGAGWHDPTPCTDWDVRELVNHVAVEDLWVTPLLAGRTIAEVGDAFDGDRLGDDPPGEWRRAAGEARTAVLAPGAMDRTVHLSYGDEAASEYAMQLFADHLIHGHDLLSAAGADTRLPDDLVHACAEWMAGREQVYRDSGMTGPRPDVPDGADEQTLLLAMFGRAA